jgi:hypothetical protein
MTPDPAKHFLKADIALERERVAQEQQARKMAVERLTNKVAPVLFGPDAPGNTSSPARPPGFDRSDEAYARRRWSPRRSRWPQVHEYDRTVQELERRQADLNAQAIGLRERHAEAVTADREALAVWAAGGTGTRPTPTASALEQRIDEIDQERDALELAVRNGLDEKERFVDKNRGRLVREAEKAHARAVEKLQQAITAVEQARADAIETVAAERWGLEYPSEDANAGSLRLPQLKGGRLTSAIPEFKGLALAGQVIEWLREDAAWLGSVLDDEQHDDQTDPHFEAVWEASPEGQAAMRLANKRLAEGLKPRNVNRAGWEA